MAHGKHREANKPTGERGRRGYKKSGPRRILRIVEVESGDLGGGWVYEIERWDSTTGATEFGLRVTELNNVGVRVQGGWKLYGQLDHAQDGIEKLLKELRR